MSEENAEVKTAVKADDKGTVVNVETELKGAEIRDNIETHNEGVTFEPLFKDEGVSEAELRGDDSVAAGEKKADPGPKGDESTQKAAEEAAKLAGPDGKAEADAKVKADADAKAQAEKPTLPKEVVDKLSQNEEHISGLTTAVSRERQTVKVLKTENQRLAAENEQLKQPKASTDKEAEKFKDFKVLSEEEYDSLVDKDPDSASKYLYKLNKYQDYQSQIKNSKTIEARAKSAEKEIVDYGISELEKVLPGITQGKNDLAAKLTEFAVKHGVDDSVLAVLTDPRTKVITPQGENLIIGDGAAQLVALIKSTFEAVSNVPDRAKIEAELRPIIEAEVQKKIIDKLKQNPSMGFRSLDALAGSGGKDAKPLTGVITESDYAKMTEQEKAAALGG